MADNNDTGSKFDHSRPSIKKSRRRGYKPQENSHPLRLQHFEADLRDGNENTPKERDIGNLMRSFPRDAPPATGSRKKYGLVRKNAQIFSSRLQDKEPGTRHGGRGSAKTGPEELEEGEIQEDIRPGTSRRKQTVTNPFANTTPRPALLKISPNKRDSAMQDENAGWMGKPRSTQPKPPFKNPFAGDLAKSKWASAVYW